MWLDDWLDLALGGACVCCALPGRLLCPGCREALPLQARPVRPHPCPDGLAPAFAAAEYADPVRRMILLHKERRAFALARPLGEALVLPVRAGMASRGRTVLVPVPSRPAVVRARGHDPMLRITRAAARTLRAAGADVVVCSVLRQRDVVADQAGLTAVERAANLADRMAVRPGQVRALARSGTPVTTVVCDDVLTRGSTAREAQRALEDIGLPVAAICCVAATRRRHLLPK
ncbi:putative amidophosphoribosyltransferase [Marmoricola sp. URHA0025 HA25]